MAGMSGDAVRVAGCDLGKATACFVVAKVGRDGALEVESKEARAHEGRPLEAFREWYRREGIAACRALGATGLHADEITAPALTGLPEEACVEAALALDEGISGAVSVVSIGARGYSVLTRDDRGRIRTLENEKCSAGTGETMVKIAGRFGLEIDEADRLAASAESAVPITARCSVFAKSEMTHFGNQGRPADTLFKGYFASVATYVAALLSRARIEGPVVLIGGGARIGSLVSSLQDALGDGHQLRVAAEPMCFEALGAAKLAAEQAGGQRLAGLPEDPDALIEPRRARFEVLAPAREWAGNVRRLVGDAVAEGAEGRPAVLGLDLGSTGSKAVLTDIRSGEPVLDLYDRSRGNPVDAAQRLARALLERCAPDVRAIGLTGSGREAAATVLRAVYPDLASRIVVVNEIVAHATAAIRCDPDAGRSLSVVEIGGQDAKFIQVVGGQITESDMNKACSAGTGSFLEEQAGFYGVHDIEEFTRRAATATRPPDLGQMCTVFVAEAAAEAHNEGFSVEDLFGGFQYSVIHNYQNRVMGQRTFGQRIFFQGKPAEGPSLAWTLAAVTGREVYVPPNPGAMGAWGIGLCAIAELGTGPMLAATPFDLRAALSARVTGRAEHQCRDKRCATLCRIEQTRVDVAGKESVVMSGGACPKYEIASVGPDKLPRQAPNAFAEREALLAALLADREGERTVGVPMVGALVGIMPWVVTFLAELGLGVRVLRSDARSLPRGEERCNSYDACAPIKVAHGVADADIDVLFLPKVLSLTGRDTHGRTCPMEQALPEMVREALRARDRDTVVVSPRLALDGALAGVRVLEPLRKATVELGASPSRLLRAVRRATAAQQRYESELAEIGRRTLTYARAARRPAVVVCGALHVIHDPATNAGIPRLLRENGVLALPMDCMDIPESVHPMPRIVWADASRALRASLYARERGDLYPLLLTSFGCGPGSFIEQVFASLLSGHPHTALESDGHGGTAGYVTRVQAFLHAVRRHDRRPSQAAPTRLEALSPLPAPPIADEADSRLLVFSIADHVSPLIAAVYRSFGFDAVASGPCSPATLALGRRDCSGKECLPYQHIWGAFRRHLDQEPPGRRTVLLQVPGEGMCRNCMFSLKDQLTIERMGLSGKVALRHFGPEQSLGLSFFARIWAAIVAWDTLYQLASYHRPLERSAGSVDEIYDRACDELTAILAAPARPGVAGLLGLPGPGRAVADLLHRAALSFADLTKDDTDLRTVLLSGDIYLRVDEAASDHLVRRLNERGLRVVVEPISLLSEYMAEERLGELMGLPKGLIDNAIVKTGMVAIRKALTRRVRALHPWLPAASARAVMDESAKLLDRYPQGEAPVTIGSVMHSHRGGGVDGVVVVSPWGCGPALVAESLLRHQREVPLLVIYGDGSPLDERRLNAFAFRLRRAGRASRGANPTDRGARTAASAC